MMNRQAIRLMAVGLLILSVSACSPASSPATAASRAAATGTSLPSSALPPAPAATSTPLACLSHPGRVEEGELDTTKPPQPYLIYLPSCYDEQAELRFPVLYLLHGLTSTDDQWVRLGAVQAADKLILSGQVPRFIIVFPDNRYWNQPSGLSFGKRLVESLIPDIDATYRTLDDCGHRALGGLSRGGGWTIELGLTHPELFGALGLHSPAVIKGDAPKVAGWMAAIPRHDFPRVWLDIGDHDKEVGYARVFEGVLSQFAVYHEFHLYPGDHTEKYWAHHMEEYLRWYSEGWSTTPEQASSSSACQPVSSIP